MQTAEEKIIELTQQLTQEQLARQQAEATLEKTEEARQEFISLVAHELRVPMTSIKGYTDFLLKGIMGPINDTQLNFLNVIRTNVERMSRMVSDLSDINKIQGKQLQIKLAEVNLATALTAVIEKQQNDIELKSHTLTTTISDNVSTLHCDKTRLMQILNNVIGNAIKYTPENGAITIAATLEDKNSVHITVKDNGIGIVENEQARIFEAFFRASDEKTRQTPGNGLALHLTQLLVEMQQGHIWFESSPGQGSTFHITLPHTSAQVNS